MTREDSRARVGDVVDGRYRLLSLLGQGGMGQVFRAEHVGIKREVAIKLLHRELRDHENIQERVMREAFATGRLDHPNCVSITDSGMLEGGGTYLVMELLRGESLGDALDERETLTVVEAVSIARDILRGLQHAHSVGVVHRDLKPDNVFLVEAEEGELPKAKILDFGIAKLLGEAKEEAGGGDLTEAGMAIGSPTYMSPEQATGGAIDGRTDLYTLSLILYEMLGGEPPFFEPDDKVKALQRRLKESAPPVVSPSGEVIPETLQVLLQQGLEKHSKNRIASAEAYLEKLDVIWSQLPGVVAMGAPGVVAPAGTSGPAIAPTTDAVPVQTPAYASGAVHTPAPAMASGPVVSPVSPAASGPVLGAASPAAGFAATQAMPHTQTGPQAASLSPEALRRIKLGGIGILLAVIVIALVASLGGDSGASEEAGELMMDPVYFDRSAKVDPAELEEKLSAELDRIEAEIEKGRGARYIEPLKRLQSSWPDHARTNIVLGLAYIDKMYWNDGFKYFRKAFEIDEAWRSNPTVIKAAIRSLSSQSKPGIGQRFLVKDIGEPAIPFLRETVSGGSARQKKYAEKALNQLK